MIKITEHYQEVKSKVIVKYICAGCKKKRNATLTQTRTMNPFHNKTYQELLELNKQSLLEDRKHWDSGKARCSKCQGHGEASMTHEEAGIEARRLFGKNGAAVGGLSSEEGGNPDPEKRCEIYDAAALDGGTNRIFYGATWEEALEKAQNQMELFKAMEGKS